MQSSCQSIQGKLEARLKQWEAFDAAHDALLKWLTEAEVKLKDFTPKSSLQEKLAQVEKYKVGS